jgi:hypothetical protein
VVVSDNPIQGSWDKRNTKVFVCLGLESTQSEAKAKIRSLLQHSFFFFTKVLHLKGILLVRNSFFSTLWFLLVKKKKECCSKDGIVRVVVSTAYSPN